MNRIAVAVMAGVLGIAVAARKNMVSAASISKRSNASQIKPAQRMYSMTISAIDMTPVSHVASLSTRRETAPRGRGLAPSIFSRQKAARQREVGDKGKT